MSKIHWVALAMTGRIGGKTITRLLAHFGSLEAVIEATTDELLNVPQIGKATASAIRQIDMTHIESECAQLARQQINIITWEDVETYPANLLRCEDAPPVLFSRGMPHRGDSRAVALVGTRTPRPESAILTHKIAYELAHRSWIIVSGLALGIDGAAHQGALEAGGRTLAVLGSGLRRVYPPTHDALAGQIADCGAVLSELHPDEQVSPQTLIARNRITSGLSRAVIVVQSGEDSGSMSTARRAWQQGRTVFAVLGGDSGCDQLLANGAHPLDPSSIDYDMLSDQLDQSIIRDADSPPQTPLC